MKKTLLLLCILTLFSYSTPPEIYYPIWHVNPNGGHNILKLNRQAALAHLANHPEDFCHPGHCPY